MRTWRCVVCGRDGGLMYMLRDALWESVAKENKNKVICWGCFERLLGRRLTANDLKPSPPCNWPVLQSLWGCRGEHTTRSKSMGLDVCVHEYLEIPDTIKTEDELTKYCHEHDGHWEFYREHHKNFPKKYVKKIPVELIDWDATFKKRGLNFEDYEETCAALGRWYEFRKKSAVRSEEEDAAISLSHIIGENVPDTNDDTHVRFDNDELAGKIEDVEVFAYGREVGYQRKGANARFYEDGKWDDNTIVSTKKMLIEDWKKCFSDPKDPYYGKESAIEFKTNIIDNFEEGKTFVWYC